MSLYCGLLIVWNIDRQAGRCVQRHCWPYVFIRCVGGCSPYLTQQLLEYLLLHQDWGECSEGWAGAWGLRRGGGGGGCEFLLTEFFFFAKTSSWGLKTPKFFFFPYTKYFFLKNVPGVLKRMHNFYFFFGGGGGILGCLGRPTPHPGVARGRKTIHFFLWPWHVTG